MPELPEVEVVRRGLAPHILGRTITGVHVVDERSLKRHAAGREHFISVLEGRQVAEAARRGKFMWLTFADAGSEALSNRLHDDALVVHLGMSGQLRVHAPEPGKARAASYVKLLQPELLQLEEESDRSIAPEVMPEPVRAARIAPEQLEPDRDARARANETEGPASDPTRHLRIRVELDSGTRIDFIDQRIFGGMHVSSLVDAPDARPGGMGTQFALIPRSAAHIARDLLDPALDQADLIDRLRSRSAPIKNLLLDQRIVSGIGNIYADEALWAARLHYLTPGNRVSKQKARALIQSARDVMERALAEGGTSFDKLYVNVDGRRGYFARSLAAYGKQDEPCPRCLTPIRRAEWLNRSSYFCARCQRLR